MANVRKKKNFIHALHTDDWVAWSHSVTEPPQQLGVCLSRSYREILDEARMHKHTHKHIIPNIKFKLKLLQIKCYVLEFIKDKAKRCFKG
jgi:hypothetical protein